MNILITGGAGFIGTNLIAFLAENEPFSIRVLDNESLGKREFLHEFPCDFVKGDIRSENDLERALDGVDVVVHLAADTRVMDSIEDPTKNFEHNVIGSFQLMNKMREMSVNRLVCASTGGAIIGDVPPPVNEEMPAKPSSPYGASKLALEGYCSAFSQSFNMSCLALRFSNVYGPYSFHKGSAVAAFIRQILNQETLVVYGDGNQTRDFVYSEDIAVAIRDALINPSVAGVLQLGTGVETSVNQLLEMLREVAGPRYPFNVEYRDHRDGEILYSYCDVSKAKRDLNYSPETDFLTGIKKTWDWFQVNGH